MSPIRAADPLAQALQSVVILDSAFRAMIPILLVALGDMICGRTGVFQLSLVLGYGTVSRRGDPIVLGIAVNLLSVGLTGFLLTQIFDVRGVFRNPRIGRRDAVDQHHPSEVRSSTRVRRASRVSWSPTRARQRRALRPSDRPHGDGGLTIGMVLQQPLACQINASFGHLIIEVGEPRGPMISLCWPTGRFET